ncbi:MAG: signal recognition particle protein [Firmicutes bacterium ZCTH02-B6]|nr:MAG: signal recognition particle protein [Firmicutes bacterium ZCTH02-B6]
MFSNLAEKLQSALAKLKGRGKLSEQDVEQALREVRLALLEADVNFRVVKDFLARVKERAVGQEVMQSLTPGQQVVKIVHEELTALMGGSHARLNLAGRPPHVIMLVGLQGAGKTTSAAKLANALRKQSHRPLLVAADVYRPAAIRQLQVLGDQLGIPVFTLGERHDPVDIAQAGVSHAKSHGNDLVIIDTAGRLHIDDELMDELARMSSAVQPKETLLVLDAMTGQEAVNVAERFNQQLELTGFILTKLDGDARGGAALSVRAVVGKPIKYVGVGEKVDALEPFHPERMASRILGMGDVLTLIEKAQASMDAETAQKMAAKLRTADFTLEDFLDQLRQVRNMGPLDQILGMIPGLAGAKQLQGLQVDEKQLKRIEAIIQSMTPEERAQPHIINGSRRRRIARGSGTSVQDVNRLLKQFEQTRALFKQLGGGRGPRRPKGMLARLFGH